MLENSQSLLRFKSRILLMLLSALVVMQLLDPGRIWIALLAGLGLMWATGFLWARALSRNLRLTREMRFGWAQVGDQLEERFTLGNKGWAPAPWVEVLDHSDMPAYNPSQARGVDSFMKVTWRTQGVCRRRGLFTLGPTSLRTGDPFGLYQVQINNPASATMIVMPPILPLPAIEVAPGGRAGEGRPRRDAPERTVSASSVREYIPGDSLRLIHWRTTARREAPYVRIFDGNPAGDWWIFLDMDQRVQAGRGLDSTVEHAVILAASLADRGLRNHRAVGLVANGKRLVWLPPQEGSGRRWEILRALALVDPAEASLAELLERTRPSIGKRSSLIIITPNTDTDWIGAMLPWMWRGAIPTVLLLDAANWESVPQGSSPLALQAQGAAHKQSQHVLAALADLGVRRYLIPRELLDKPVAQSAQASQPEWRITPRGRAIPIHRIANTAWKVMS